MFVDACVPPSEDEKLALPLGAGRGGLAPSGGAGADTGSSVAEAVGGATVAGGTTGAGWSEGDEPEAVTV